MLVSVNWVPKGQAKAILPDDADANHVDTAMQDDATAGQDESSSDEHDDGTVDISEVLAGEVESLRFHRDNKDDEFLNHEADKQYDEEELEDLKLRDTDSMIVVAKSQEDISLIEAYVYESLEDGDTNLFIHHDILLPALPLCVAWTKYDPRTTKMDGNLVAVGTFLPSIDIYDLNPVDEMEAVVVLGGYDRTYPTKSLHKKNSGKKKSSSSKPKLALSKDSHSAAIMCLAWNPIDPEYLASGSADNTIKVWDVDSASCVQTLAHHGDKVQSLDWHPTERGVLLSGSFDKKVCVTHVTTKQVLHSVKLKADIESVRWDSFSSTWFYCASEDGLVQLYDTKSLDHPVWSIQASQGPASGFSVSTCVPGLFATGSTDKALKVWWFDSKKGTEPKLIYRKKNAQAGAIFGLTWSSDEEHACTVVVVGSRGKVKVWNIAVECESLQAALGDLVKPQVWQRAAMYKELIAANSIIENMDGQPMIDGVNVESHSEDEGAESDLTTDDEDDRE